MTNDSSSARISILQALPGVGYICAWGWLAPITYQRQIRDGIGADPAYFEQSIVAESSKWGANLVEFYPPEMRKGFPVPWDKMEGIPRPPDYWGGYSNPNWPQDRMREFFEYAHQYGFLVHLFYHPGLIKEDNSLNLNQQREQAVMFIGKTFYNLLADGWQRSLDGFGYENWFEDQDSRMNSILWPHHPGVYLHSTLTIPKLTPNFSGTLQCAIGRFGTVCGFSDQWQNIFLPPTYQSYQADCRIRKNSFREWDYWGKFGGGSYPDWMMKQINDFCRARLDLGSAVWWLGEPDANLPAAYRPYVYGLSQDPIRTAITTKLFSTGIGGYRDAVKITQKEKPVDFGHEYELPYQAQILQNNYLRLVRWHDKDKGQLLYDPTNLAHYDIHPGTHKPISLSSNCFSSHVDSSHQKAEIKKPGWALSIGEKNNCDAEFRGVGGYAQSYIFNVETQISKDFPACITYEEDPDWPSELQIQFNAPVGLYELAVFSLPFPEGFIHRSHGIIEVYLDEQIVGFYPAIGPAEHQVKFSLIEPGFHTLRLAAVTDSGHRFDTITIRQLSENAVSHCVIEPAGSLAALHETVIIQEEGVCLIEKRKWQCINDHPLIWLTVERQVSSSSGSLRSRIGLDNYDRLSIGEECFTQSINFSVPMGTLRFEDSSNTNPAIFLKIQNPGCINTLHWMPNHELSLLSEPDGNEKFELVFAVDCGLYSHNQTENLLAEISPEMERLSFGRKNNVTIKNPYQLPVVAVVRILDPDQKSYNVCEEGFGGAGHWWVHRGGQPSKANPGTDLLKVYLQAGGTACIQRNGYIRGFVQPGWGCQNILAIADEGLDESSCLVEVYKTSHFVFAPRLDYPGQIKMAKVNGQAWRYFDGNHLFLPNTRGRYRVEIEPGLADAPTLSRTWMRIEGAEWNPQTCQLTIWGQHPADYKTNLPGTGNYMALIQLNQFTITGLTNGGKVIRSMIHDPQTSADNVLKINGSSIIEIYPGRTTVSFTP